MARNEYPSIGSSRPNGNAKPGPAPMLSRDQYLDAAEALFDQKGVKGVTVRAIANKLGCAVGTTYRYFKDVDSLMADASDRIFERSINHIDIPGQNLSNTAATEAVRRSTRLYIESAQERIQLYRYAFWLAEIRGQTIPAPVTKLIALWAAATSNRPTAELRWDVVHSMICRGKDRTEIESVIDSLENANPTTNNRQASTSTPIQPKKESVAVGVVIRKKAEILNAASPAPKTNQKPAEPAKPKSISIRDSKETNEDLTLL